MNEYYLYSFTHDFINDYLGVVCVRGVMYVGYLLSVKLVRVFCTVLNTQIIKNKIISCVRKRFL